MPPSTKRSKPSPAGFDIVAAALDAVMFEPLSNKKTTAIGVARAAYKQLTTTFSDSLKGTNKTHVASVSPPNDDRPRRHDHRPTTGPPSPVPYRTEGDVIDNMTRPDAGCIPFSSAYLGMMCLHIANVLRMRVGF